MFLLGFVSSTFEARRLGGDLELVHLSLEIEHREKEKEKAEGGVALVECKEEQKQDVTKTVVVVERKRKNGVVRVRRPSVEDLPPDLYMEPLLCVLKSPVQMPVNVREQDDVDQEWSFWNLDCQDNAVSRRTGSIRLASALAEAQISTGVQHHPLEASEERESNPCESSGRGDDEGERGTTKSGAEGDEGFERILQHLQRIEGSVKDLKARVDDAKLRIEQSEHEWGRESSDQEAAAAALPSLSPSLSASPSLQTPVMEKMGGPVVSPELPYSWNKKVSLNSSDGGGERLQEERELRYSPPLVDSDVQDVLSFRRWEQEAPPKPKRSSRKKKTAELDLETALDLVADEYAMSKDLKLPLHHLFKDNAAASTSTDRRSRREPSPSSFTCGLSPTSLFSDDQEPFRMSVSIDDTLYFKMLTSGRASPRSVLSAEVARQSLFDGEESSDLDSPTTSAAAPPPPFPTFTYNLNRDEIGETSSDSDSDDASSSLDFFLDASNSSPWLGREPGVLNASDLEFLLSPDMQTSIVAFDKKKQSPKAKTWVPYVKGEAHAPRQPRCAAGCDAKKGAMRHSQDVFVASLPKAKRSVNFAADLVREIPPSPEKKPPTSSVNIPPRKEGPSIMTSRRRWGQESRTPPAASPPSGRRRQQVVEAVACSGKLFRKWPQKLKSFKLSKGKVSSSDDEDAASFGTSARRDAEQVRRILKGSQKRYSNLTVDEMMKEDFTKWR